MKIIILVHIIALTICSCGVVSNNDDVKPFIPGVYVRHYKDEYTDSYDTITIQMITADGSDGYVLTRRTRFKKLDDTGNQIPGYELKRWTGMYDDKTKTIWLQVAGKRIYFDTKNNELKIGTEPYKKL